MRARLPRHATVVAYLALILALSGTAYATAKWTGAEIVDESLTTADVADNSLTGADIADGSIAAQELASGGGSATSGPFETVSAMTLALTNEGCAAGTYRARVVRSWGDTSAVTIGGCAGVQTLPTSFGPVTFVAASFDPLPGADLSQWALVSGTNVLGGQPPAGAPRAGVNTPGATSPVGIPFPAGWSVTVGKIGTSLSPAEITTESLIYEFKQLTTPNP